MSGPTVHLVQCWDDGVHDDIALIEILRRHGAKATFNLNPGLHAATRSAPWVKTGKEIRRLARPELCSVYEGFTIANHSVSHVRPLEVDADRWRTEVVDGRKQLQDLFGQPVAGFAYPYGNHNPAVRDTVRAAGHVYARTVENARPCFPPADPMAFHPTVKFNAPDFWDAFEACCATGGVFYFWGHSYELVTPSDWQDFEDKIARLTSDPRTEWADLPALFS